MVYRVFFFGIQNGRRATTFPDHTTFPYLTNLSPNVGWQGAKRKGQWSRACSAVHDVMIAAVPIPKLNPQTYFFQSTNLPHWTHSHGLATLLYSYYASTIKHWHCYRTSIYIRCEGGCEACSYFGTEEACLLGFTRL